MAEREYFQTLSTEGDAIHTRFTIEHGRVLVFTVQYEVFLEGEWKPVVRFDTAHGRVHRDLVDPSGHSAGKDWNWFGATLPYNEALTAAQQEIITRWRSYRRDFLRRQR